MVFVQEPEVPFSRYVTLANLGIFMPPYDIGPYQLHVWTCSCTTLRQKSLKRRQPSLWLKILSKLISPVFSRYLIITDLDFQVYFQTSIQVDFHQYFQGSFPVSVFRLILGVIFWKKFSTHLTLGSGSTIFLLARAAEKKGFVFFSIFKHLP